MPERFRQIIRGVFTLVRPYFVSDQRRAAWLSLLALLALALIVAGINWVINYTIGQFMGAISKRDSATVPWEAGKLLTAFALATTVTVVYRFTEERLGLRWRQWLTHHLIERYMGNHAYYGLLHRADIDNPDQRIAEDAKTFTTTMLSIVLIVLNSTLALAIFSGVLWSITPWLFAAASGYALLGTAVTIFLGQRLVRLNIGQYKMEADLRYHLIRVRETAEASGILRDEPKEKIKLDKIADAAMDNFRLIVGVNRNMGFFTTYFNYFTQILPVLIVAPLYLSGGIEFAKVIQAQNAFTFVLNAFSLIVTEFQRFSSFTAVVVRLSELYDATENKADATPPPIIIDLDETKFAYHDLTLHAVESERVLLDRLECELPLARHVLVTGSMPAGEALVQATTGLWPYGKGAIARPPLSDILSIPRRRSSTNGTLRDQMLIGCGGVEPSDGDLEEALRVVGLEYLIRDKVWEESRNWGNVLSQDELMRVAIARFFAVKPRVAFLDASVDSLAPATRHSIYERLRASGMAYFTLANSADLEGHHDMVLRIEDDGRWTLSGMKPA